MNIDKQEYEEGKVILEDIEIDNYGKIMIKDKYLSMRVEELKSEYIKFNTSDAKLNINCPCPPKTDCFCPTDESCTLKACGGTANEAKLNINCPCPPETDCSCSPEDNCTLKACG